MNFARSFSESLGNRPRRCSGQVENGAIPADIIVLFFPRPGKKCNWLDRNLSPRVEETMRMGDARGMMSEGEKARVRTGRPPVITMIRTTKRSVEKRTRGTEERIVQRRSTFGSTAKWRRRRTRGLIRCCNSTRCFSSPASRYDLISVNLECVSFNFV